MIREVAITKRPMSTKKVHRPKKRIVSNLSIVPKDTTKFKRKLSFFRGLVIGVAISMIVWTEYSRFGIYLLALNLLTISYALEVGTETVRDKSKPKKIDYL